MTLSVGRGPTDASRPRGEGLPRLHVALLIIVVGAACTRGNEDLLPRLKSALAERDRKLTSYRFSAEAHQGDAVARHAFAFRSPNKMRGTLMEPDRFEWAFDGTTLARAHYRQHKLEVYALKLPPAKASVFLHDTFSPFVFEGFRAPLLPPTGATAKLNGDKVEVSAKLADDLDATWVFKWPSADFVSKSTTVKGERSVIQVDEEQCDAKLGLCVPKKVSQHTGDTLIGSTTLNEISLNPELPEGEFTLHAGEGWTTETHEVIEQSTP
ncbi:MAG: hypothetical protein QM723_25460 [Myxococcaceae bacterium]